MQHIIQSIYLEEYLAMCTIDELSQLNFPYNSFNVYFWCNFTALHVCAIAGNNLL